MGSKKIRKMVYLALLTALAVVTHIVEASLPIQLPYGVKLGFANIISLVVVELYGVKEMFIVNFFRVVLSGLMTGSIMSYPWFMSCGGVFASSLALFIVKNIFKLPVVSMSVVSAIAHIFGQLIVISYIMSAKAFIGYIFIALFSAVATGIFVGMSAVEIIKRLKKMHLDL